jgi:hypothetical protein
MVLEVAINGGADAIVTFNIRDFTGGMRFGVKVDDSQRSSQSHTLASG